MNSVVRTVLFWAVIVVSAFLLWQVVRSGSSAQPVPEISHSDFLSRIASGQVGRVIIMGQGWPNWILNLAPLILLAALWFFMIRQMQTGGNKALSFGKSRARLLSMQQKKV